MTNQQNIRYWTKYKRYLAKLIKQVDRHLKKLDKVRYGNN